MTDAPERIWICPWGGNWSPMDGGTQQDEYIRADVAAAMVAAEREACAEAAVKASKDAYEAHRMAQGHEFAVKTATAVLSRQMLELAAAIRKRGQQ